MPLRPDARASVSRRSGGFALLIVLWTLVLVAFIGQCRKRGDTVETAVYEGTVFHLRPVLMTAARASLGFLPMASSISAGAEVELSLIHI